MIPRHLLGVNAMRKRRHNIIITSKGEFQTEYYASFTNGVSMRTGASNAEQLLRTDGSVAAHAYSKHIKCSPMAKYRGWHAPHIN